MESDRPFSHTTSAVAMSSTLSFPCPIVCAAMRLGAGHPASQSPRSSSCRPRSKKAPPPASWRRSRHATRLRLGWNVYQPQRIACSMPMSPEEAAHRLHVGAKAVVHPDHHAPTVLLARLEHPLHPGERK